MMQEKHDRVSDLVADAIRMGDEVAHMLDGMQVTIKAIVEVSQCTDWDALKFLERRRKDGLEAALSANAVLFEFGRQYNRHHHLDVDERVGR